MAGMLQGVGTAAMGGLKKLKHGKPHGDKDKYMKTYQLFQQVQQLADGGMSLPVPRMVVIGDQSGGKSALLASLTGLEFPQNSGMCTKAPIVVECIRDDTLSDMVIRIQERGQLVYGKPIPLPQLAAAILERQAQLVSDTVVISSEEVRVRVSGPKQIDVVIVDLPGIIHNGPGKQETRELVHKYCEPEQTLIIVVSEAKQDPEVVESISIAKKHDPEQKRTLRVLTKFDVMGSDAEKERAIKWVREDPGQTLGVHAVACRPKGEEGAEGEYLEGLPADRAGVESLKEKLPAFYQELLKKNIPELERLLRGKLSEIGDRIKLVGEEAPSGGREMIIGLERQLLTKTKFEQLLAPLDDKVKASITELGEKITAEWAQSKFAANPYKPAIGQGGQAVEDCLEEIFNKWVKNPIAEYVKGVAAVSNEGLGPAVHAGTSFNRAVHADWLGTSEAQTTRLESALDKSVDSLRRYSAPSYNWSSACDGITERGQKSKGEDRALPPVGSLHEEVLHAWRWHCQYLFGDILRETRDIVVLGREAWIRDIHSNDVVLGAAKEDASVTKERADLKGQREKLRNCLKDISSIGA